MNLLKGRIGFALALAAGMLVCNVAAATPITMNFDGLSAGTSVDGYYDGGCSSLLIVDIDTGIPVDCNGPDDGVAWNNAHIRTLGGSPSAPNYIGPGLFSDGTTVMDVAAGFDTGLTFYYTTFSNFLSGTVTIYDGLDGNGSALTSLDLAGSGLYCQGQVPCWLESGLSFSGTAKSVVFASPDAGFPFDAAFGLDDVTVGANLAAVPEPAAFGIFGLGLLLIGAFVGLRRRLN